jgi:hypothetical protein
MPLGEMNYKRRKRARRNKRVTPAHRCCGVSKGDVIYDIERVLFKKFRAQFIR